SISAAAKAYNVSKSTLFRRIHRRSLRQHFILTNKKLSKTEEEVLIKDILKLDLQGLSPSLSPVRDIADTIRHINTSIVITAIDRQGRPKHVKLTNTT
ncbi:hypothetical protein M433DRAFT_159781, partial [Acidomyces richmondensis BFW]